MHLAVIMPAVIQNRECLDMTLEAVRSISTKGLCWGIHLICNRLNRNLTRTPSLLDGSLLAGSVQDSRTLNYVEVISDRERTVAGAWNEGIRRAFAKGADYAMVMANDARLREDTVVELLNFASGPHATDVSLWSACQECLASGGKVHTDGADFSAFMLSPRTLAVHGYFDENFRPAYFEDNDYYARVILGGFRCRVVHQARFLHLGSQTIRHDAEMAHHVRHWFPLNRDYFVRKWGNEPVNGESEVLSKYYQTPFNVPGRPLSYWTLQEGRGS